MFLVIGYLNFQPLRFLASYNVIFRKSLAEPMPLWQGFCSSWFCMMQLWCGKIEDQMSLLTKWSNKCIYLTRSSVGAAAPVCPPRSHVGAAVLLAGAHWQPRPGSHLPPYCAAAPQPRRRCLPVQRPAVANLQRWTPRRPICDGVRAGAAAGGRGAEKMGSVDKAAVVAACIGQRAYLLVALRSSAPSSGCRTSFTRRGY